MWIIQTGSSKHRLCVVCVCVCVCVERFIVTRTFKCSVVSLSCICHWKIQKGMLHEGSDSVRKTCATAIMTDLHHLVTVLGSH